MNAGGLAPASRRRHSSFAPGMELLNRNVAVGIFNVDGGWAVIVVCGTTGANFRIVDTSFLASSNA